MPKPTPKPRKNVTGSVRIRADLRDELREAAHHRRSSMSAVLAEIVTSYATVPPAEWAPPRTDAPTVTALFTIDPTILARAQTRAEGENVPLAETVIEAVTDLLAPL